MPWDDETWFRAIKNSLELEGSTISLEEIRALHAESVASGRFERLVHIRDEAKRTGRSVSELVDEFVADRRAARRGK